MSNPNASSAIPPFIPGLLIVSLLVVVCLSIGWRNYLRRGIPRTNTIQPRRWNWEGLGLGQENESFRLEKPRMWEVGVCRMRDEVLSKVGDGWKQIMPLSATPIDYDTAPPEVIEDSKGPPDLSGRLPIRGFPDLSFLPSPSFRNPKKPTPQALASSTTLPERSHHHLQLSVIISMPTPASSMRSRLPNASDPPPAEKHSDSEPNDSRPQVDKDEDEREEEIPEVAFGVAVVPWLKGGDGEFYMMKGKSSTS